MERNQELFEKIAAQIEETPHLWDQDVFADDEGQCGTVMCVAGWATHFTCGLTTSKKSGELVPANGKGFSEHAAEVLGLERYEASDLFFGCWDQTFGKDPAAAAEFLRAIGRGAEWSEDGDFTE